MRSLLRLSRECSQKLSQEEFDEGWRLSAANVKFNESLNESLVTLSESGEEITLTGRIVLSQLLHTGEDLIVSSSGSVQLNSEQLGIFDLGISSASLSPDLSILTILHSDNSKITLLNTDADFAQLSESLIHTSEAGEDKNTSINWGKKETQFHGSVGKTAALEGEDSPIPLEYNSGPAISWRGDGDFFCVSVDRLQLVYSKAGVLQSKVMTGSSITAWRPGQGAPMMATVQHTPLRQFEIAFYEKNGLRHGGFTLSHSEGHAQAIVTAIRWDMDGATLAVQWSDSHVQLYTTNNWHWYLKQTIIAISKDDSIQTLSFDLEAAHILTIVTNQHVQVYTLCWSILDHPDTGLVAVIDGRKLLLTPMSVAQVPPPMSAGSIEASFGIQHCAFNHDGDKVAVLTSESLECWSILTRSKKQSGPVFQAQRLSSQSVNSDAMQVSWIANDPVVLTLDGHLHLGTQNPLVTQVAAGSQVLQRVITTGNTASILHSSDGAVFHLSVSGAQISSRRIGDFPNFCSAIHVHPSDVFQVFGLCVPRLKFFSLRTEVASDITSFTITPTFLIVTTRNDQVKFLQLHQAHEDLEELFEFTRNLEKASKIVTPIWRQMSLVLQLPRGNLETIYPRAMVMQVVKLDLTARRWREAFLKCRKHRLDMNLIVDNDSSNFFADIKGFVGQIPEADHLNLFLTTLRNTDVTKTGNDLDHITSSRSQNKLNLVCDGLKTELDRIDPTFDKYVQTKLTCLVRKEPPQLEDALSLLLQVKGTSPENLEAAVKYLAFLVPADKLYNLALGMYDFDLVVLVAQFGQIDPREYIPFLNDLRQSEIHYRKFRIDNHLGKFLKALKNLSSTPEDHFEEALEYIVRHGLYCEAIPLFRDQDQLCRILSAYGEWLVSDRRYSEAGYVFCKAGDLEAAVLSFEKAHLWRECMSALMSPGPLGLGLAKTDQRVLDMATALSENLSQRREYLDAATLLRDYADDLSGSIKTLCKGLIFNEARRIATLHYRFDYCDSLISKGLQDACENMEEELAEMQEQLNKQMKRFEELQALKKANPDAFFMRQDEENNPALDNVDVMTDAASGISNFTRYTIGQETTATTKTGRSMATSARNRRKNAKKSAIGRRGTISEECYILSSLGRLIDRFRMNTLSDLEKIMPEAPRHGKNIQEICINVQALCLKFQEQLEISVSNGWPVAVTANEVESPEEYQIKPPARPTPLPQNWNCSWVL